MVTGTRRSGGILKRLVYYTIIAGVFFAAVKVYLLWLSNYNRTHPELVRAQAMGFVEELPLEGLLIWDEQLVTAPRDGTLTYPSPFPRRVAKGETVAAVDGAPVKVKETGYFIPALDGQEGTWVYSRLWPDASVFPVLQKCMLLENGAFLRKGDALGKLVHQPQDLRCITYLDRTPSLERDIEKGYIAVKTEPNGKILRAVVRAPGTQTGAKIKLYLTLPFFPPELLWSRTFSCRVVTGDSQGVVVPETAVVLLDGKLGVMVPSGSQVDFKEVEGFPADSGAFFISKGLLPEESVVLYAEKVRRGDVIRVW